MAEERIKMNEEEVKTVATAKKPPVPRADQGQQQANFVGEVARQVQAILASLETAALVSKRKYDAAKLATGLALAAAFETARAMRQETLGGLPMATASSQSHDWEK